MIRKDYNSVKWSDHFYIDKTSPTGLRWSRDVMVGVGKGYLLYEKSSIAGNVQYNEKKIPRAWKIKVLGVNYFVHRIIWVLHYGIIDNDLDIDHLDCNCLNNKIANLRLVSMDVNMRNRKLNCKNKTGICGVYQRVNNGFQCFVANWTNADKTTGSRSFSTSKYGSEEAFRLACEYRTQQIALLNAEGANYTERHGTMS